MFLDFIKKCLEWDVEKRMTPEEAIRHEWVLDGLPPKVLYYHHKVHNIPLEDMPLSARIKIK